MVYVFIEIRESNFHRSYLIGISNVLLVWIQWSNSFNFDSSLKKFLQSPTFPLRINVKLSRTLSGTTPLGGFIFTASFFLNFSMLQWSTNFSIWSSFIWNIIHLYKKEKKIYRHIYLITSKICQFFDNIWKISYHIFIPNKFEIWIFTILPAILGIN